MNGDQLTQVSSSCYEVTILQVLAHTELPSETTFGCEIFIPGTEYFVRYYSPIFNEKNTQISVTILTTGVP